VNTTTTPDTTELTGDASTTVIDSTHKYAKIVYVAPTTYTLTVTNGSGGGSYTAGYSVTITANAAPSGQVFDKWTSSGGGTFTSAASATTTFTMPTGNVTIEATYKSSGGSSSSSTGGGPSTPSNPTGSFLGGISTFEKGTNENLIFIVQKDFSLFRDVKVDGALLTRNTDYKAESSSTKITLYADYLNTLSVGSHTLVVGFTDGTSATATFTVKDAVTDEPISWENPFTDVFESDWFYNDVKYTHQNGLFAGTGANTFSPQMPMTRGMVVTVLGRLAGIDIADYIGNSFDDVDTSQYYTPYVKWAVEMGIVSGVGNNNYAPDADISRQDLAVILYIYAVKMGIALPETETAADFDDGSDIASYAAAAVEAMQKTGIISGKPGNVFDPQGIATRAEVAAMLHRFVEAVK